MGPRDLGRAVFGWILPVLTPVLLCLGLVLGSAPHARADFLPLPSPSLPVQLPTLPPVSPPKPPIPTLPVSPPPLPTLPPLPTPTIPISVNPPPTPTLPPVTLPPVLPTPSITPTASPSPRPSPTPVGAGPGSGSTTGTSSSSGGGGGGQGPGRGITIPFTGIVLRSPLDVALLAAIAVLPLLGAIWLLVFGRTYVEARRSRDAQVRLAIAHDLGLAPRELVSVSAKTLYKLREEAAFDELTGVMRRAAGIAALDREIARARRQKAPLSVAFVDVDGLKEANDKRGHKAGDELLRNLAGVLKGALRAQDLVVRYGGDEFICVLPDTVADSGRAKMSWVQTDAESKGINFSAGVAQLEKSDDIVSLLGRADSEMYAVKSRRGKIRDLRLGVVGASKTVPA